MNLLLSDPAFLSVAAGGETDPYFSNVSLLLHGDGTNGSTTIVDSSPSTKTVSALNGAQISTAQSKFGGASIAFDGQNDYLSSTSSDFAVGTSDFTTEAFLYINSFNNFNTVVGTRKGSINSTTGWSLGYTGTPGGQFPSYALFFYTNGGPFSAANLLSLNTWYHVAVSREGSTIRLFLDGTIVGTSSNTQNLTDDVLFVGAMRNNSGAIQEPSNGYIDEVRVTKGVARYTSNFTPPTAPFPNF